ncbi:YeiH family protein [Paenibacillus borealis]|uniref:Membrane protein n=1 Tax=Paenibacillus borealis TaxID=160799 RepID=A0A089LH90_PAEBO|nr:YeiH family protein [Paenibacillus borealis]AIQ58518.1 membrane protein [Paenibacillus borealis]
MNRSGSYQIHRSDYRFGSFAGGIAITLILAVAAKYMALLPVLGMMGQLVLAILLGIGLRAVAGVPEQTMAGVRFSGKRLLRAGIILLGMRLNLGDIVQAGPKVLAIAAINLVFTLFTVYGLARWLKMERRLGLLTACGTAICGAATVAAIAPQIKATDNETAVGAATVAILGTIFTLVYTILYPYMGLSASGYGIFTGATLHEVAHVIAAAIPAGQQGSDLAILVKLTRVAMLVPVALILGLIEGRRERKLHSRMKLSNGAEDDCAAGTEGNREGKKLPVPWFIAGFLLMSGINTLGVIPQQLASDMITLAYLLLAMAMAGLGLGIDLKTFSSMGRKPVIAGFIGSVFMSLLGIGLVHWLGLS